MAIATFDDLSARISGYLKGRNDLTDRIPEFITLAEKRIHRALRVEEMVTTTTIAGAATMTLPTDFLDAMSVELQSDPRCELSPISARHALRAYNYNTTSRPTSYRVRDDEMLIFPSPQDTTDIDIEYMARPLELGTSQQTNTIFPTYADIHLFAAMAEASLYLMDDARATMWDGRADAAIQQANKAANRKRSRGARVAPAYGAGT